MNDGQERRVYGVSELTRLVKDCLQDRFGALWVQGEVSNFRRVSSGHCYFTIKDEGAQIQAVLFRGDAARLRFQIADGLQVLAFGQITVYEKSGSYQIVVRMAEEAGKGSLQAAFEALKKKLQAEGLFEQSRKRPLPALPRHVGVVTSPTGAAIHDILKVLSHRFPDMHIVIAPAKVQGEGAAQEVAAAIELLNARGGLDAMIVGRGGGSIEDLWCFNEEMVARAIAASAIPVISAVGHETDFTISDFVADVRAPTPSAAAELLVARRDLIEQRLAELGRGLASALKGAVLVARRRLADARASYVFAEPRNLAARARQRVREAWMRMGHSLDGRLGEVRQRLDVAAGSLPRAIERRVELRKQDVKRLSAQLRAMDPSAVLTRGYSMTLDSEGRVVTDASTLRRGQRVRTRLSRGEFESEVVKN